MLRRLCSSQLCRRLSLVWPRLIVAALEQSCVAWNETPAGCHAPKLRAGAARERGAARTDGRNVVVVRFDAWCPADAPGTGNCYDSLGDTFAWLATILAITACFVHFHRVELNFVSKGWKRIRRKFDEEVPELSHRSVKTPNSLRRPSWRILSLRRCSPALSSSSGLWTGNGTMDLALSSGSCGAIEALNITAQPQKFVTASCQPSVQQVSGCHVVAHDKDCRTDETPEDSTDAELTLDWTGNSWAGTLSMTFDSDLDGCTGTYAVLGHPGQTEE